jgi:hypothetical protein
MPGISRKVALTEEELDSLMTSSWNMRIATASTSGRINLTPMWLARVQGKIYFTGRGQKIVNLRENPTANVLVDGNERFPELVGAMFQGTAQVREDAAAEEAGHEVRRRPRRGDDIFVRCASRRGASASRYDRER